MAKHDEATKAAAMAALLQGQSINSVAREYKIPKGTVGDWKARALEEASGVAPAPTQKERIGKLLVEYLEQSIITLKAQALHFADPAWLAKQDASALAVLHGVQTDKAIRLLEALGGASNPES